MLLTNTPAGLFCAAGGFHIDPWQPVDLAIITHGHSDHARPGSRAYLASTPSTPILQQRLGADIRIESLAFGESIFRNGVKISLHPAGHILGSAQVRLEHHGEVCVVSGDYKLENDGISEVFELVRCHTFVTESTFGLPIYRWRPQHDIFDEINSWWRENQKHNWTSVLYCYSLGKAQRLLSGLNPEIGPIYVHGAIDRFVSIYREASISLPPTSRPDPDSVKQSLGRAIVLAPGSADNSPWLRKFGEISTAVASGWMQIRGTRRRRSLDRGFILSDHADWPGLLETIDATGAENVWVTHGYVPQLCRWLREHGKNAVELQTKFGGETEESEPTQTSAAE